MALEILRTLNNGTTANYHMITDVQFSREGSALGIYWAGFKDHDFRTANWEPGNTDKTSVYREVLVINGDDFLENVYPYFNDFGAGTFAYNLLKERIPYLQNATDVM